MKENCFDKNTSNMVKCIAIILMLMHHVIANGRVDLLTSNFDILPSIINFSTRGRSCIAIFVFITAYGITSSFTNDRLMDISQLGTTSIRRWIKLFFNYLFIYILTFVTSFLRDGGLKSVFNSGSRFVNIIHIIINMLGLSECFGTPTLNVTWWYMVLAYIFIFLVPLFIVIYRKIGVNIIVISFLSFYIFPVSFDQWFLPISLGVWAAEENIFTKIHYSSISKNRMINSFIIISLSSIGLLLGDAIADRLQLYDIPNGVAGFLLSLICVEIASYSFTSGISKIMSFVGKHSMNMFLTHTLIYYVYFQEQIYSFRNWFLVLVATIISTLLLSIIIEWLKNVIDFYKFVSFCQSKV